VPQAYIAKGKNSTFCIRNCQIEDGQVHSHVPKQPSFPIKIER
jgi:hypothetical protein